MYIAFETCVLFKSLTLNCDFTTTELLRNSWNACIYLTCWTSECLLNIPISPVYILKDAEIYLSIHVSSFTSMDESPGFLFTITTSVFLLQIYSLSFSFLFMLLKKNLYPGKRKAALPPILSSVVRLTDLSCLVSRPITGIKRFCCTDFKKKPSESWEEEKS